MDRTVFSPDTPKKGEKREGISRYTLCLPYIKDMWHKHRIDMKVLNMEKG